MTDRELEKIVADCRKNLFPSMIAWAYGFFKGKEAIVVVRLTEGCDYEIIEDLEEWMMGAIESKLARGQTIEFYWQLMR